MRLKIIEEYHPNLIEKMLGRTPYADQLRKGIENKELGIIGDFGTSYVFLEGKRVNYGNEFINEIEKTGAKVIYLDDFSDPTWEHGVNKHANYEKLLTRLEELKDHIENAYQFKTSDEKKIYNIILKRLFEQSKGFIGVKKLENLTDRNLESAIYFLKDIIKDVEVEYFHNRRDNYAIQEMLNIGLREPDAKVVVLYGGRRGSKDSAFRYHFDKKGIEYEPEIVGEEEIERARDLLAKDIKNWVTNLETSVSEIEESAFSLLDKQLL